MGRKKLYSTELYRQCKKIFDDFYMKYFNLKFYYDTKQSCALGEIINRLILLKKGEFNDADIAANFKYLLYNIDDSGFIWDNLTPAMLISMWNDVLKQCRKNYRVQVVKKEDKISNQYKQQGAARIETGTYKDTSGAQLKEPTDISHLLKEIIKA